jgi:hypothetical protein
MSIIREFKESATTKITDASKQLESASAVVGSSVNALATNTEAIKDLAQSGATNFASNISSQAAGALENASQAIAAAANKAANDSKLGNLAQATKASSVVNVGGSPPFPNVLHNFASYTYVLTLSSLDENGYNFPDDNYKANSLGKIILRSASGFPESRVETEYGKFDFFMDNLNITTVVKGGHAQANTDSVNIDFKIIEPYSMGLFFQSLEVAALENGFKNYLEAPYLLTIEFIGHVDGDNQNIHGDSLSSNRITRHFPLQINEIDMTVTHRGAEYNVRTIAYNFKGFQSTHSCLKSDVSISGKKVHEILQTGEKSLQKVINDYLKEAAEREKRIPDQVIIYFPKNLESGSGGSKNMGPDSATVDSAGKGGSVEGKLKISKGKNETLVQQEGDINVIGSASLEYDFFRPGDQSHSKDNQVYDTAKHVFKRDKVTIDPNKTEMRFAQDSHIVNIINNVIIASGYCKTALEPSSVKENGQVPWWRVQPQVYFLEGDNITTIGRKPRLIVYRVVPYGMDAALLLPPNANNPKSEGVLKQALKEYNYIYTSKNLDVIKFDINFKVGFYRQDSSDIGQNSDSKAMERIQSNTQNEQYNKPEKPDEGSDVTSNNLPVTKETDGTGTTLGNHGGSGYDTPQSIAARRAHDILLNSEDLVNLDMTILGDPYYIGDSGVGNYVAKASEWENMTADHAINTQNGECTIVVNFRTPLDLNPEAGDYKFGPNVLVNRFSGVYTVTECLSTFSRGRFTQTLKGMRIVGQTSFDGAVVPAAGVPLSIVPPKSTDTDLPVTAAESGGEE